MTARFALGGLFLVAVLQAQAVESDLAGSRDPLGIERFPRSWIVEYARDPEVRPRQFVVHRLERLRRGAGEHALLRFDAALESAIYRIPDGVPVAEVAAHFLGLPEGGIIYRCGGRDCGRSNEWANDIFGEAILYGPDGNQQYLAWEWQGRFVSVYIIERGNKRIYANVQVLEPAEDSVVRTDGLIARRLEAQGWTVIDGIVPDTDGQLPPAAAQALAGLAPALAEFTGAQLYLVCHLYDPARAAEELRGAAERCARSGIEFLATAGLPAGIRILPFGAGSMAPRGAIPSARLELVAPGWLTGTAAPRTAAPAPRGG